MSSLFVRISTKLMIVCLICSFALPTHAASLTELSAKVQTLQKMLVGYQALLFGSVSATPFTVGTIITVTSDQQLLDALVAVTGGETIQLAPGTYSSFFIRSGQYNQISVGGLFVAGGEKPLTAPVTIMSQSSSNPAVLRGINVQGSSYWHFKNVAVQPPPTNGSLGDFAVNLMGVDNRFEDSTITYGNATGWSLANWGSNAGNGIVVSGANSIVRNNTLKNVYIGISVSYTAPGTQVKNNTLDGIAADGMRVLADNVIVDSNIMKNFKAIDGNHPDCIQTWASTADGSVNNAGFVTGVTIINNICNTNENSSDPLYNNDLQGYANFNGSNKNWLVQNNVFIGTAYHGIAFGGTNNIVRNNTIIDANQLTNGADAVWISLANDGVGNTYQDNIANKYIGSGWNVPLTMTNSQTIKAVDYAANFRDWTNGDVRLLSGSALQGAGANLDPATVGSNVTVITPPSAPAPTLTLTTSPTSIETGNSATLTWSTTNATACTASGDWSGSKSTSGSQSTGVLATSGIKVYTLTCTGTGSTVSKNVNLMVTEDITTPSPTTVYKIGDRISVKNKVNVRTTGLIDASTLIGVNLQDSQGVLIAGPTISEDRFGVITWFKVDFDSGFDGWVGANNYILVFSSPTTVPTLTLSATPALITVGDSSLLTWSTANATSCTASGAWNGSKSVSGSESTGDITSVGTSTYQMTCIGDGESIFKKITIRALPASETVTSKQTARVMTNDNVNVRSTPNGIQIGIQYKDVQGTLGTQQTVATGGHTWVYVNFDSGVDGYVAKRYLTPVTDSDTQIKINMLLKQLMSLQVMLVQMQAE